MVKHADCRNMFRQAPFPYDIPENAKGEKNVVLNCTIGNVTGKAIPLAVPAMLYFE